MIIKLFLFLIAIALYFALYEKDISSVDVDKETGYESLNYNIYQ